MAEEKANVVIMNQEDNVATALTDLKMGNIAKYKTGTGWIEIQILEDILFGHKIAIKEIPLNGPVMKYGEVIGIANRNIFIGSHAHIHNIDSVRGKGVNE